MKDPIGNKKARLVLAYVHMVQRIPKGQLHGKLVLAQGNGKTSSKTIHPC